MSSNSAGAAGGGAIYGLGIFGAFVYYWQQADSFWEYVLSFIQGLFWPAWMDYEVYKAHGSKHRPTQHASVSHRLRRLTTRIDLAVTRRGRPAPHPVRGC
jgi:hypothetical protein